jgi:CRP/FNR family transcriptional regulator, nitrogen oxide reductase regulator
MTMQAAAPAFRVRSSPLFDGLTETEVRRIVQRSSTRPVAAGDVLIQHGRPLTRLILLVSGMARWSLLTESGADILLRLVTPGDVVGLRTLLPPSAALGTLSITRPGEVIVWERSELLRLKSEFPTLLENALQIMMKFYDDATRRQIMAATRSAQYRIRESLLELSARIGVPGELGVEIGIRNDELSDMAQVSPFTTSRTLSRWQSRGLLVKARGKVVLLKGMNLDVQE